MRVADETSLDMNIALSFFFIPVIEHRHV